MNLDPDDSQIHILLINIDSLSLSLSLFLSFPFLFPSQTSRSRWEVWRVEYESRVRADWLTVKFP